MNPGDLSRVPVLLAAAALLIGGVMESPNRELSAALFAAGFIVTGAWLTLEAHHHMKRRKERTPE